MTTQHADSGELVLSDFPKISCPYVRKIFRVNRDQWKKYGGPLKLKNPEVYLAIDEITPGYEWVFDDPDTIAVEKLDGTNVKLLSEKGRLVRLQNRKNVLDPLQIMGGKTFIIEGIFRAIDKDFVQADGEQVGEVIGPKLQGNPYKLAYHLWYPFDMAVKNLTYRSFHEHPRDYSHLSAWFKDFLFSRFHTKMAQKSGSTDKVMAEGVIFYNLRRRAENKTYMAKLRRDMFPWFYQDQIEILDAIASVDADAD